MKRFSCSDSLGALLYPSEEEKNPKDNCIYNMELQAMLDNSDDKDSMEESGQSTEKKRRLSNDQVKALEKIFEVDKKLDPDRKVKLAQELGLEPRQVAVWFQNRRARLKAKQLERDYNYLKANNEALELNYNKLQHERQTLIAELKELKAKLGEENRQSNQSDKEEAQFLGSQNNVSRQSKEFPLALCGEPEPPNKINLVENKGLVDFKDGLSDGDSCGMLNEGNNLLLIYPALTSPRFDFSSLCSPSLYYSQFLDSRAASYQQQLGKMEENYLFNSDESCNNFSVDQAPSHCCYFPNKK